MRLLWRERSSPNRDMLARWCGADFKKKLWPLECYRALGKLLEPRTRCGATEWLSRGGDKKYGAMEDSEDRIRGKRRGYRMGLTIR